jgi:hypothetical protein
MYAALCATLDFMLVLTLEVDRVIYIFLLKHKHNTSLSSSVDAP